MEKHEINTSKWSYTKAAAWSGTIGLPVAVVYALYNFMRFGERNEPWGGLLGGIIGPFFLIILGFVVVGVILFGTYKFIKKI